MDVYEIEKIVRKGGSSLADALHEYWPALPDSGVAERNTTLHLGHELIKAGFDVYAEHKFKMKGESELVSLDLLALNHKEETQIRIEAKMGTGSKAINGIHQDLKKIKSFQLADSDYESYYKNKFGIIICTSWDSTFIEWWENPFKVEPTKKGKDSTENEKRVGRLITRSGKKYDCLSGTYPLHRFEEDFEEDDVEWQVHGMQYLIFELNKEIITKFLPKN